MRHGVTDQAHAPEHQEHTDRAGAERQRNDGGQRAAHELEIRERIDQGLPDHQAARAERCCG